jgi:hypothetical protein
MSPRLRTLQENSDGALLFWIIANVIADGAAAGSAALGFALALLFHITLRRGQHRNRRRLAYQESEYGKSSYGTDEFSHFSSPSIR